MLKVLCVETPFFELRSYTVVLDVGSSIFNVENKVRLNKNSILAINGSN
jgi:hypothetical protein